MDHAPLPPPPWELIADLSASAQRFLLTALRDSRGRSEHILHCAQSVLRARAAYLAQAGTALDQDEFLAISDTIIEAFEYNRSSEDDATLAGQTLAALVAGGLSLDHPVVTRFATSPRAAHRYAVAGCADPATPAGRSLLLALRKDPIEWVRKRAHEQLPPEHLPPPWFGLFTRDPEALGSEAERAAAGRVVTAMSSARDYLERQKPAPSLGPDLDLLSDACLLDLALTALEGAGVTRVEAPTLLERCIARDLGPPLIAACWPSWSPHFERYYPVVQQLRAIHGWPDERRGPAQRTLAWAFAIALTRMGKEARVFEATDLVIHEAPWRLDPVAWIDDVLEMGDRPATQAFAHSIGVRIEAALFPETRRAELVGAWIRGETRPQVFAPLSNDLSRLVAPMPRAQARAWLERARKSPSEAARTWAIRASFEALYDADDGPRDDIALRLLADDTLRPLIASRTELARWFTRPLRRGLVEGTLRAPSMVEALILAVCRAHDREVFGEEFLLATLPAPSGWKRPTEEVTLPFLDDGPLSDAEWDAIRAVRAESWAADTDAPSSSTRALVWLPNETEAWTDDDHAYFASVLARTHDARFHNAIMTPALALAMLRVWRPAYVPFAQRFADDAKEFDDIPSVLAALREKLGPARPAAAPEPGAPSEDDWGDA